MELARAEEVEYAVEVARLPVEAVLVEVGVVAVAQLHHLAARAARAQLAEPRLRQPLEEAPGGLEQKKKKEEIDHAAATVLQKCYSSRQNVYIREPGSKIAVYRRKFR